MAVQAANPTLVQLLLALPRGDPRAFVNMKVGAWAGMCRLGEMWQRQAAGCWGSCGLWLWRGRCIGYGPRPEAHVGHRQRAVWNVVWSRALGRERGHVGRECGNIESVRLRAQAS